MGPRSLGPRRNEWAACASRQSFKSTDQPSGYWLTAHHQEKWFSQTIHTYKPYLLSWVVILVYEAHFECHDILMLGKSPIKWTTSRHDHCC